MTTVAQLPAPVLTQAHRDAMAYIQDLAITITMQGTYAVSAEYSGHVHTFNVDVMLFSDTALGNYTARKVMYVSLPGDAPYMGEQALPELQGIARELEALLTPPTGDAA
ncbi:hypothetical protein [Vreelandella aquamarina]|uniref:Uncharacterized protein n=1 Tax=Vreelandella aquamarina TaxID=77097 RepID=A0A857GGT0_9GAMM|nr:hypothetical protein [Halomonas meridiana]QHD48460.1 hypothetical protein CTT34_01485 [Halomonas meridiana]